MDARKTIVLRTRQLGPPGPIASASSRTADTFELEEADLDAAERADLRRDPRVRAVAEAMPLRLIEPRDEAPVAAQATSTWGVDAVGATTSPFDGSGITVAVLDTGIEPGHPAFAGMTLERRNFTTGGDDDTHGHGTHCAGTVFGRDVGGQRIGVARGVDRALIGKVLGPGGGSTATLTSAIHWALDEGAHVISMSLGIDFPGFVDDLVNLSGLAIAPATSIALEQYRANIDLFGALTEMVNAHALFGQGTLIVAASGNESERPSFEIAVAPPAAGVGVLAVGALGESAGGHRVAPFSNTEVDLSGPGVGVVSAALGGGLVAFSGTSMATPHVAGVAALWAQKLQNGGRIEPDVLRAHLVARSATAGLAAGFRESDVGAGMVQAPAA